MTYPSNYNRNRVRLPQHAALDRKVSCFAAVVALIILAFYVVLAVAIVAGTVILCRAAF